MNLLECVLGSFMASCLFVSNKKCVLLDFFFFFFELLHYKEKLLWDKVVVRLERNEHDSCTASMAIGID